MEVFELFLCHKYKKQQNCFIILIFPKIQSFIMSQNIVANGKTFYCYPIQLTVFLSFSNSLESVNLPKSQVYSHEHTHQPIDWNY